ncbi:MAG: flagellin [Bradymonadia bacterium]
MGLFVNSNSSSMTAMRNLNRSTRSLGTSFQRLSSGMRINSAKDDAAGLAISERMTTQVRGLTQAIRNTNDGMSLAQTAEGALQETTSILQRMRELSVQSANDTNTDADRSSIQEEVDALISEMNRIAEKTTFNNQNILDGSFTGAKFHIGANARENLTISVKDARATQLGRQARYESASDISVAAGQNISDGDVVIRGVTIRSTVAADDTLSTTLNDASAIAKAAAINDSTEFTGVSAIVDSTVVNAAADISAVTLDSTNNITINGVTLTGFRVQNNDADDKLVSQINAVSDETGVIASLDDNHRLVLTAEDGRNVEVTTLGNATQLGLAAGPGTTVTGGRLTLVSEEQFDISGAAIGKLGDVGGPGATLFGVNDASTVQTIDLTSREGANRALSILDSAIGQVSSSRASLGAVQNRLASTVRNLEVSTENLTAARSRIQDADFASESAKFSKDKIVQQAGVSILSQANQQPNIALSLIGG